ncbi:MAG: alpha/beta hydrolase [Oscillospiraceae bacterium]|nr:alpha/beta hydrolase [Oscillospiraceae bacterium]
MEKRTKRIILGAGTAAVGAAVFGLIHNFTLNNLVKIAIGREIPKIVTKNGDKSPVAGEELSFKTHPEVIEGREYLENCGCETVEITSFDGLKLVGHWYAGENPKRVIVAMHGWRSSWCSDFGVISRFWHENGCAVLYAEQRGQGSSDGEYIGFGLLERYDCLEWIKWVCDKTDLPVYLAGVSMGAATVMMTSGFELPENIRGIIADCGYTSPKAIWKHVVENNLHLPYGLYSSGVDEECRKKIQHGSDDYSCMQALEKCKIPVLFIHGSDDKFVPVEMTYENYKACASEKRLFIVPGASHGMSYMTDTAGYQREILEFWADNDK